MYKREGLHYMKYFLLICLCYLLSANALQAQVISGTGEGSEELLLHPNDSLLIENGDTLIYRYTAVQPFVSGQIEFSPGISQTVESVTVRGGIIWRNRFVLGGFATSLRGDIRRRLVFPNEFQLNYEHAGGFLGYHTDRKNLFDFRGYLNVSLGEAVWSRLSSGEDFISDRFMIIHPTVGAQVNLSSYFKIHTDLGYRKFRDLSLAGIPDNNLDGFTVQLGITFGLFNHIRK